MQQQSRSLATRLERCFPLLRGGVLVSALACSSACALATTSRTDRTVPAITLHESTTATVLHGKRLDLHLAVPDPLPRRDLLIVYASGDGGWFGSAVDQWRRIARAGYATVGFSARTFLHIERPKNAPLNPARLADEYARIVEDARQALGWQDSPKIILAGWSRGAAFSVLVGGEPLFRDGLLGVVAFGLPENENLTVGEDDNDDDNGSALAEPRRGAFDTYARLLRVPAPCAVIQATGDKYFPAASARQRFGPDTATRRFYEIDAKNHRFAGGSAAFSAALIDVLKWMVSRP